MYVQRSPRGQPLSVLPLNPKSSYLLPGQIKTLKLEWNDGFPSYVQTTATTVNSQTRTSLKWDWGKIQNFRIGKYYANIVAVYNDGQHDVPIIASISFWVIPWKILLLLFITMLILVIGIYTIVHKIIKIPKKYHKDNDKKAD